MSDTIRKAHAQTNADPSGVARRDFLLQGSAALVGAGVVAGLGDSLVAAALPTSTPLLLSVGFSDANFAAAGVDGILPLVAGESLRAADTHFKKAGTVKVRIHGFRRAATSTEPCSLFVLPRYPAEGCPCKVNVLAWNYVDRGCGQISGSPHTFTMPIGADGVVEIAIDRRAATSASSHAHHAHGARASAESLALSEIGEVLAFRTDNRRAALKLRRGRYAIAVGARPQWSSVAMLDRPLSSDTGPLVTGITAQPVAFDYVLLSIS